MTAMSDLPERIWYIAYGDFRETPSDRADDVEYIRKDIADAAVQAERERCAERFANHDFIRMRQYVGGWRHDVYSAICNGDQP
jgi:hypothetical protein